MKYIFAGKKSEYCHPKIYIKSKWNPHRQSNEILESMIDDFEDDLSTNRNKKLVSLHKSSNLSTHQRLMLQKLKYNTDFIILMTDKNLGPAIMERDEYIKHILAEHLEDGKRTYRFMSNFEADNRLAAVCNQLRSILREEDLRKANKEEQLFDKFEYKYLLNALSKKCIPQFYGTPKVHKKKIPRITFRPVVSQCGSLNAAISTFLDYLLDPMKYLLPSYVKNSISVAQRLKNFKSLRHRNAKIFTSDAKAMYSNIDWDEGQRILYLYLSKYVEELPLDLQFDVDVVMKLMKIVMTNNIFQFGNTSWLQRIGTAMGTPCACVYAMLFFGWFEREDIIPNYNNNLLFYCRQIDDIFGIWIDDPDNKDEWSTFQKNLNSYSQLEWKTSPLSHTVDFLDLTITITNEGNIETKTFQKKENLFLYIPPHSAHPPGMLQGLVFGLMETYLLQNTQWSNYITYVRLLYQRLLARGHKPDRLKTVFTAAAEHLSKKSLDIPSPSLIGDMVRKKSKLINDHHLFFHPPFGPQEISRREIQMSYARTCNRPYGHSLRRIKNDESEMTMRIERLIIAYSRPKNLRDVLNPTKLKETDEINVSKFRSH